MNREIDFEEEYMAIKLQVMEDEGYDEDDMEDGSIEDEVNTIAREIFEEIFGFEYDDLDD
jgi:hypothetical protein